MRFCSLSSGSDGNCEFLEYENTRILIDAGLSGKKIENLLKQIDVDPSTLDGIFVTHEHIDHAKGIGILSRRYNLKVFSNHETFVAMAPMVKNISPENSYSFELGRGFNFKDLYIKPIGIFHDCESGCGFVISGRDKKVSILTDTGYVNSEMMSDINGSDLYFIEANHDRDMLLNGSYPWSLKQRIASNRGHLSNDNAVEVLGRVLEKKNEVVILSHLSKDNNTPLKALRSVRDGLGQLNIFEGIDYSLEVAPREEVSRIYKVGEV